MDRMPSPYFDDDGTPRLRLSWVYCLDALGTKEAARSLTDEALSARLAPESWYHRFIHHGNLSSRQGALYFTDNVVVAAPADDDVADPSQVLGSMLQGVGNYVVGMAIDAFLAYRGGVTMGSAFIADRAFIHDPLNLVGMAHGQAIVDAVLLEGRESKYPRIVVDPTVVSALRAQLAGDRLATFIAPLVLDEGDGRVFLDHLSVPLGTDPTLMGPPDRPLSVRQVVESYRDFVVRGMAMRDVHDKYLWLARYFNAVVANSPWNFPSDIQIADVGRLHLTPIPLP